jgi:hypothetical protein
MTEKDNLQWEALEHAHREKTTDWYWALGIVSVTMAVISIILSNILFAVLILVASFTLMLHGDKKPRILKFEIKRQGIVIDNMLYPYSTLDCFWIEEHEESPKVLFKSQKLFVPLLVIPLSSDIHPDVVRDALSMEILEKEIHEPFAQKVMEKFGVM